VSPETTIIAGPPGPLRVRARLVLVAMPKVVEKLHIGRDAAGRAIRPPEALWFEERTIEHVIQVR
jgi:hypothetical protein